jgi:hypothetical protein
MRLLLGIAALALLLGGCGGGESESTSESTSGKTAAAGNGGTQAQKESFVDAVNNICFRHSQEQEKQVEAYKRKHGIPQGKATVAQKEVIITKIIMPIVRETIAELEEYEPSPAQKKELDAFVEALTKATDFTEKNPHSLADEKSETTPYGKEPYEEARLRAADMGTYLCGQA